MTADREQIESHLRQVTGSDLFVAAPMSSRLLTYLVEEKLAGRGEQLKGYSIGIDVFERADDFDASADSIVRVQVGRLRKLLERYYKNEAPTDQTLHIEIPLGSYEPQFTQVTQTLPARRKRPSLPATEVELPPPPGKRRLIALAAVVVLLAVSAAAYFLAPGMMGPAKNPTVFVAKYRTTSDNEQDQIIVEGLQTDLLSQLAQYPGISVIGYESVNQPIEEARRENFYGADYILKGVVSRTGNRLLINSALVEARTNEVIWSDDKSVNVMSVSDLVASQSLIAVRVGSALGQPYGTIQQAASAFETESFGISFNDYACIVQAHEYVYAKTPTAHEKVRNCLEGVVAERPQYAEAWALLSLVYGDEHRFGFNPRSDTPAPQRALNAAERAVAANPLNPLGHEYLAIAQFNALQTDAAEDTILRAISLEPNDANLLAEAGWNLAIAGEGDQARNYIERAMVLNPEHPDWYWGGLAIDALRRGDRDDALTFAKRFNRGGAMPFYIRAAAERLNGNDAAAKAIWQQTAEQFPGSLEPGNPYLARNNVPTELASILLP